MPAQLRETLLRIHSGTFFLKKGLDSESNCQTLDGSAPWGQYESRGLSCKLLCTHTQEAERELKATHVASEGLPFPIAEWFLHPLLS